MNVIMMMFDSLNRRFLTPYGSEETLTPNFERLMNHTVRFENSYAGSLPCIPARRELHTGRYNFLHRSWGPLEPFDVSMPGILNAHGIHSHLVTDHGHYFEEGGATYHCRYSTWEYIRGQEGDKWIPKLGEFPDEDPNFHVFEGMRKDLYRQNRANRTDIRKEEDYPLVRTISKGLEFLQENYGKGDFFLQIESFSPHEPFMAADRFKDLYGAVHGKKYEWPDYAPVTEDEKTVAEIRKAYFADLSMCDEYLGKLLDFMDEHQAWEDTMLIVNTDHGYMLGEHGYFAKNYMPCYDETVHTPLFIWDPRHPSCYNETRSALVQTIDLPATVLSFFGLERPTEMLGTDLENALAADKPVHENVLFGQFGGHICITDGRFVYMRALRDKEAPLYEYTLLPTHMMEFFSEKELRTMEKHGGFSFTKGLPVMRIETGNGMRCSVKTDLLFDLENDPAEENDLAPVTDPGPFEEKMRALLRENDAPESIFKRYGL